jgi:hypothetical protein
MKKTFLFIILMFTLVSCARTIYSPSDWQYKKVTIDGKISDWTIPPRFFDETNGINYTISNDRQNLYLFCSVLNEQMQLKILYSGIEFAIDTVGKKSFPISIKYPYSASSNPDLIKSPFKKSDTTENRKNNYQPASNNPQAPGSRTRIDRTAMKYRILSEKSEMQLTGFKPPFGNVIPMSEQNKTSISAAIDFDKNGTMYYEAAIPFSTFYKNELVPSDSNKVFNYRIKVNPAPDIKDNQNRGNGMRSGGNRGGMSGGGGRHGGMSGGEMGGGRTGGGGMHSGGMNGGGMYGENSGGGGQRSTSISGTTKIEIKLRLATVK